MSQMEDKSETVEVQGCLFKCPECDDILPLLPNSFKVKCCDCEYIIERILRDE